MARREISAGCVIYRINDGQVEVILTRPRDRDAWVLPKGLVEAGESAQSTAAREASEETGLQGRIVQKIDTIKYTYKARWENPPHQVFKIVTFYLMEFTGGDPSQHDWEVTEVGWFPINEAIRRASYKTEKDILRKAQLLIST